MCAYVGGKIKSAQFIVDILNKPEWDHMDYIEPFCGYCSICMRVLNKRSYSLSDNDELLICLLRGIQSFTSFPDVTREEYSVLKNSTDITFKRAISAWCYSFSGKKWGGYIHQYVRPNGRIDDVPQSRKNYYKRLQHAGQFQCASLDCCDYKTLSPTGKLIYADPPYRNSLGYGVVKFDSDDFWETMREWSRPEKKNVVFISEYLGPPDFVCVGQNAKSCCMAGGDKQKSRIERLFLHESSPFIPLLTSSPPLGS